MINDLKAKQRQFVFDPLLSSHTSIGGTREFRKKILRTPGAVIALCLERRTRD